MTELEKTELEQKFDFFKKAHKDSNHLSFTCGVIFMTSGLLMMLGGSILGNQYKPYPCDFSHGVIVKITK